MESSDLLETLEDFSAFIERIGIYPGRVFFRNDFFLFPQNLEIFLSQKPAKFRKAKKFIFLSISFLGHINDFFPPLRDFVKKEIPFRFDELFGNLSIYLFLQFIISCSFVSLLISLAIPDLKNSVKVFWIPSKEIIYLPKKCIIQKVEILCFKNSLKSKIVSKLSAPGRILKWKILLFRILEYSIYCPAKMYFKLHMLIILFYKKIKNLKSSKLILLTRQFHFEFTEYLLH